MSQSITSLAPDWRMSPKWLLALSLGIGQAIFLLGDNVIGPSAQFRVSLFGALFYVFPAVTWALLRWQPALGRWAMIAAMIAIVYLGQQWLGLPGFLTLLVIPTAVSAVLISLPAALVTAIGITILLVWLASASILMVPLVAIWATLGVVAAIYRPVREQAQWSWDYFQQAQTLLEEAQARKVELEQALNDLARANLQLTRLNMLAQGLRQAAEEARRAKSEFVANVSHELRTPLNMITGFSEMILRTPETYGGKIPVALLADLTVIQRNAAHLSELIDDVLDLSQIEAKQMALTKEQVHLPELVEAAVVAVRPLFESKGLYLQTDVSPSLPPLFCDRTRIREVLLNLLSNAGRFTEQGGVQLRVWLDKNDLAVSVTDTGPGIADEDIDKLFEPFQQMDASLRRRYGGTGLGLNISKQFIELHGGRIWVESEPGAGTTFSFSLPAASPLPVGSDLTRWLSTDWEYVQRTHPSKTPKVQAQPRLVALENGQALQRLLSRYLDGVEIAPVTTLEAACQELSASPSQALLINHTSVSAMLHQLEGVDLPDDLPVMVCSVPDTYAYADILGASDYLIKPVSQEALLAALNRLHLPGKTILLVDDEPDMLRLFRRMLAASGQHYRVLRASNGQEALGMLREQRPNVILLDLVMPKMDGFQLLQAKSQDPALKDIPVIVISARDPAGQPIVSGAFAVTRCDGLSAHHLLTFIKKTVEMLATAG